ncbi:hypothetical protein GF382_00310 [Candidatus Falkowbacteria bacterium]|nr:hypothetical protein [Candidatus Falkowbacteria bacterium]
MGKYYAKVLFVDDHPAVLQCVGLLLKDFVFPESEVIKKSEVSIKEFLQINPDLFISDSITCPGIGVVEFVREAKEKGWEGEAVVCSGYEEPVSKEDRSMFLAVIKKPATPENIKNALGL